jgi:hypothetical protein
MTSPDPEFSSFSAFWPHYLAQHRRPSTRAWHYAGLGLAFAIFVLAGAAASWALAIAAPFAGYALSWAGHWLSEGNQPATFRHPLWSLRGDFRMAALALTGRLKAEMEKYRVG